MGCRMLIAAALVLAGSAGPALADTKAGVEAWQRGDYAKAVAEWRRGADAGEADAQFNLGQAYKLGRGVPLDTRQAEAWYAKAAAQGHLEAADNYGLALFQNGRPRDAVPWLEKSSERGEPRAQYIFGTMLFNGTDTKKDWVRAYALTSLADKSGLPQAAQSLQQMDTFLSASEKQQGLALARRMDSAAAPATPNPGPMRTAEVMPPRPVPTAGPAPREVPPPPPTVTPPKASTPAPALRGNWQLQLGAFGDPGNARRLGAQLGGRFPGRSVDYVKAGALTRVLVGPYASRAEAQAACGSVKPCVPITR